MGDLEKVAKAIAWVADKNLEKKYHDELVAQRERHQQNILEQNQKFHVEELKQQQELETERFKQYESWQKKSVRVQNMLVMATWALVIVSIILKFVK